MNKEIIVIQALLASILICAIIFLLIFYNIDNKTELSKIPNKDTTCGEGTEERDDGKCYPINDLLTNNYILSKIIFL